MDNNFRNRYKSVNRLDKDSDLSSIWADQQRMQAEDERIARELQEHKRQAKELSRKLREHKYGEFTQEYSEKVDKYTKLTRSKAKTVHRSVLPLLKKGKGSLLSAFRAVVGWSLVHRKSAGAVLALVVIAGIFTGKSLGSNNRTDTLGQSVTGSSTAQQSTAELPREKPEFKMLLPQGRSVDELDIVRISPDGNAPAFAYLDRFDENSPIFRVTVQEVPDNFELAKTATEFQATSVIQIDEMPVYHGYSEKGTMQTLIFVKDGKLVFIRCPIKYEDDIWASYILSMQ